MKRKLYLALASAAMLILIGCSDPYGACVKAGADIASGIGQGMQTVDGLRQQGLVTSPEEQNVLNYLEYANKGDQAFLTCVSAAHTSGSKAGSFTACAQSFNSTLNNPQALLLVHVTNTTASATVSNIVNGVTSGVSLVITQLGGK